MLKDLQRVEQQFQGQTPVTLLGKGVLMLVSLVMVSVIVNSKLPSVQTNLVSGMKTHHNKMAKECHPSSIGSNRKLTMLFFLQCVNEWLVVPIAPT